MTKIESLVKDLPDAESATRFLKQFSERNPSHGTKLLTNDGLLSDVLTLASYSPLLATTLIQNPEYLWWLNRKRSESSVRNKDELLESLARFALTNSQIEPQVLFARFRRRELLRIFLRDIRRLGTIAEITEEISNLADAILENALRIARQEMDNRFGSPFEVDGKGRKRPSEICIVSLGKLGSKELNYSSDIDLLFIYSAEGESTGTGSRGSVTNREYFVKLAESITKLVGQQAGEGAAYRVDLRLRPHGRVGALALSIKDTIRYYTTEARRWERQVLIRSRSSAGNARIFKKFFDTVENEVFSATEDVETALHNVFLSKEKIDFERKADKEFDVKLGRGGIREIEFIAQALQLSYGGKDKWLRAPHTLISLSRLADRDLLNETELTGLFEAYDFLRHLEHILQMENGLQTHSLPSDTNRRNLIARRMRCANLADFESSLQTKTDNVHNTFVRVFGESAVKVAKSLEIGSIESPETLPKRDTLDETPNILQTQLFASLEKADVRPTLTPEISSVIDKIAEVSPKFTELLTAKPLLVSSLKTPGDIFPERDYKTIFTEAVSGHTDLGTTLSAMRTTWSQLLLEIAIYDIFQILRAGEIKNLQTKLAEASIEAALIATRYELSNRLSTEIAELPIAVLALGKLGSETIDYDSDLDLVLIHDEREQTNFPGYTNAEFYSRGVEIFVTMLSSMTRDGNLYRVDLRLRPHGKNGPSISTKGAFVEYIERAASIWELLAYVQIRGLSGKIELAHASEDAVADAIRTRAAGESPNELRLESRRIRLKLESQHADRHAKEIDIKFGVGGLLDVYFVVRYLHLLNKTGTALSNRSTAAKLEEFLANGTLSDTNHAAMSEGYAFLSELDHNIRLLVGRVPRLPRANHAALERISERMHRASVEDLLQQLALHRINIRAAFDNVLSD